MGRQNRVLVDEINRAILTLLQENGRMPFKEIGVRVGLSCTAVIERVHKMEDAGVIEGFTIRLNPQKVGFPMRALVALQPHSHRTVQRVLPRLEAMPGVLRYWYLTGDREFVVELACRDVSDMDSFLEALSHFGLTFTSVVLKYSGDRRLDLADSSG